MNKGSKGLCVTVTPSGKEPISIVAACSASNTKDGLELPLRRGEEFTGRERGS